MPLLLILLLAAPLLDIYLLLRWLFASPLVAALYWVTATAAGALLLKFAKIGFGETLKLLQQRRAAVALLGGFAAVGFAGVLLIFPGYISDIFAVVVLAAAFFIRPPKNHPPDNTNRPLEVEAEIIGDERQD